MIAAGRQRPEMRPKPFHPPVKSPGTSHSPGFPIQHPAVIAIDYHLETSTAEKIAHDPDRVINQAKTRGEYT